jgi:uncharacterized protein (UPF0276 family)
LKFALNYSPQAADLLRSNTIEVDLFKCPDWPDLIEEARTQRPVYVHFPLVAGEHNVEQVGLKRIAALRTSTQTPYVNTHIAARYQDLDDPEDVDGAVETMLRDILPLVERFGPDAVMAENVPCPDVDRDKPPVVVQPETICRLIQASGCGLLLDLAHARLASATLGVDVYDYISRLPVDRLREVHVTGVGFNPNGVCEDHLPMTDEDWALFDWAMDHIHAGRWARPAVVACEYGGIGKMFDWRTDPAVLAHDIPRIYRKVVN